MFLTPLCYLNGTVAALVFPIVFGVKLTFCHVLVSILPRSCRSCHVLMIGIAIA